MPRLRAFMEGVYLVSLAIGIGALVACVGHYALP